jgi:hypothetical protein
MSASGAERERGGALDRLVEKWRGRRGEEKTREGRTYGLAAETSGFVGEGSLEELMDKGRFGTCPSCGLRRGRGSVEGGEGVGDYRDTRESDREEYALVTKIPND